MDFDVELNDNEIDIVAGGAFLTGDTGKYMYHTVQRGDCLSAIGARYQVVWTVIYNINRNVIGANPDLLQIGTVLKIPVR